MASNPMQKKAINSFLLGFFTMLIIAAVIGGVIFFISKKKKDDTATQNQEQVQKTSVYALSRDINSGEDVTPNDVNIVTIDVNLVPSDAYGTSDIYGEDGFYRDVVNNNGEIEQVARFKSKIDLKKGTVISEKMLYETEVLDDTERVVEYNMLQLPTQLEVGEYIDVRFLFPNGQDFIVVSHKEILDISEETIWLRLTELEIDLMDSAIVESYMAPATNLYVVKYVEPGLQPAQTSTYTPSMETLVAITQNPNIQNQATANFASRYNSQIRGYIQSEINKIEEDERTDNVAEKIQSYRDKARSEREEYLYGVN